MIPQTHGTIWSLLIVHDRISQYILYTDGSFNLQQSIIFYKIIIRIWSGCSLRTKNGFLNGLLAKEGGKCLSKTFEITISGDTRFFTGQQGG